MNNGFRCSHVLMFVHIIERSFATAIPQMKISASLSDKDYSQTTLNSEAINVSNKFKNLPQDIDEDGNLAQSPSFPPKYAPITVRSFVRQA
ncbi:hypothetical protein CDAR_427851 [Caerostris darwini]|uniref:Uncharacterized protein n=1 Tax=Caerostris darwini TaxID=1538125 RepID=A0AAV4Q8S7_9ARAC|nr:hypothetical protein CDAR_427851 [Caerostris darwini]